MSTFEPSRSRAGQAHCSSARRRFHAAYLTKLALVATCSAATGSDAPEAGYGPGLGRTVTQAEVRRWELHVPPDGAGLPGGSGTVRQGQELYELLCRTCHGDEGAGGVADELAGAGSLTGSWPDKNIGTYWPYATTIFDFVRRSMPMTAPGSLTPDQVYSITAYLLYLNALIGEEEEMSASTLPLVTMPNRDGFLRWYPHTPK